MYPKQDYMPFSLPFNVNKPAVNQRQKLDLTKVRINTQKLQLYYQTGSHQRRLTIQQLYEYITNKNLSSNWTDQQKSIINNQKLRFKPLLSSREQQHTKFNAINQYKANRLNNNSNSASKTNQNKKRKYTQTYKPIKKDRCSIDQQFIIQRRLKKQVQDNPLAKTISLLNIEIQQQKEINQNERSKSTKKIKDNMKKRIQKKVEKIQKSQPSLLSRMQQFQQVILEQNNNFHSFFTKQNKQINNNISQIALSLKERQQTQMSIREQKLSKKIDSLSDVLLSEIKRLNDQMNQYFSERYEEDRKQKKELKCEIKQLREQNVILRNKFEQLQKYVAYLEPFQEKKNEKQSQKSFNEQSMQILKIWKINESRISQNQFKNQINLHEEESKYSIKNAIQNKVQEQIQGVWQKIQLLVEANKTLYDQKHRRNILVQQKQEIQLKCETKKIPINPQVSQGKIQPKRYEQLQLIPQFRNKYIRQVVLKIQDILSKDK